MCTIQIEGNAAKDGPSRRGAKIPLIGLKLFRGIGKEFMVMILRKEVQRLKELYWAILLRI